MSRRILNGFCPLFKLTETQSESSYYSPQKVKSREVLCLEQEGMTIEVRFPLSWYPKQYVGYREG